MVSTLISEQLTKGAEISSVYITIQFTEETLFEITADFESASPTWETVSLTSGTRTAHVFAVPGDAVAYRITANTGTQIYSTKTAPGCTSTPGIKIEFTYT